MCGQGFAYSQRDMNLSMNFYLIKNIYTRCVAKYRNYIYILLWDICVKYE